jgi:hypothetical protein
MDADEYDRRYLNTEVLLFCEAEHDDLIGVLEDVRIRQKVYLVYQDEESNPEAVMVSFKRYGELLAAERAASGTTGAQ